MPALLLDLSVGPSKLIVISMINLMDLLYLYMLCSYNSNEKTTIRKATNIFSKKCIVFWHNIFIHECYFREKFIPLLIRISMKILKIFSWIFFRTVVFSLLSKDIYFLPYRKLLSTKDFDKKSDKWIAWQNESKLNSILVFSNSRASCAKQGKTTQLREKG